MKPFSLPEYLRSIEEFWVTTALTLTSGNKLKAARMLGLGRTCLVMKMKKFGMPLKEPCRKPPGMTS